MSAELHSWPDNGGYLVSYLNDCGLVVITPNGGGSYTNTSNTGQVWCPVGATVSSCGSSITLPGTYLPNDAFWWGVGLGCVVAIIILSKLLVRRAVSRAPFPE